MKIIKSLAIGLFAAATFNISKLHAAPASTIKAGLPITIGTPNYVAYSFIDPMAPFGVGLAYNLYFGNNLAIGLTGAMAFNLAFPNPAYIGGGASLNYVIAGGAATEVEGDFLTLKSYPDLTAYAGLGFAAKQFDFSSQVTAALAGGQAVVAGPTDIDVGTFYGLMINGGVDYTLFGNLVLGAELHFIMSLASNPEVDPMANIIEIIIGAGYML